MKNHCNGLCAVSTTMPVSACNGKESNTTDSTSETSPEI